MTATKLMVISGGSAAAAIDQDLTDIGDLSPANDDLIQRKAGAWTNRTPAQVKADLVLVKADVGLPNVTNTAQQPIDQDLTDIAALTPSNDDVLQRKAGAWTNRTPAQVKADMGIADASFVSGYKWGVDF